MERGRFDVDALKRLAGQQTFARGAEYFRDGRVTVLALERDRVLATVRGSETYRTELTRRGSGLTVHCTCRAFEDWDMCKHIVATALAANEAEGSEAGDAMTRIREHLKAKSVDVLTEMIVELAAEHPPLLRKLELASAAMGGDDKAVEKRLLSAIDDATRTGEYVEYAEARDWAAGVDDALDAIEALVPAGKGETALNLAEHAINCIEEAIQSIDDSDGYGGVLLNRAAEIHLAAARLARPEPTGLARYLFASETGGDYETFAGAAGNYAEVLGEEGLGEYRRLASEAWNKLPPRPPASRELYDFLADYRRLAAILDFFAERDGDVNTRIALRTKDLSSPWRYLELAQFCLLQGRKEEAISRAEEGLWIFEDKPDERLVLFVVDLLTKAGRKDEAEKHLWAAFKKVPSLDLYGRLRKLGGEAARDRALAFLERQLGGKDRNRWSSPVDLVIGILMKEKMFESAWAAVGKHGASAGAEEALAQASEASHPREALDVYGRRVDQLVGFGNNQTYAEAAKIIARMGRLRGSGDQAEYVNALKSRFGRKRNFMKLLG